jgi:coenzyme F420-0:L-glutamate ligase/coenzyme F420-1:gamma-L-glutamate ligase
LKVEVVGIEGIPEIVEGDNLGRSIAEAAEASGVAVSDDDILVITQKVVSKAEGRIVDVPPGDGEAKRRVIEDEAARILRRRDSLTIAETRHGFVCASAGVDSSNIPTGKLSLLPADPDRSARRLRRAFSRAAGSFPPVVISDTFGRAWRIGQINVAIGIAGMDPVVDLRGTPDDFGAALRVTTIAVADEVAAAAELVMGKTLRVPAAVVRGVDYVRGRGRATTLVRRAQDDLFR